MIPTRAFQKIGNARVIGFDPTLAAFGVVRDQTVWVLKPTEDDLPFVTFPKCILSSLDNTMQWSNLAEDFTRKYSSELLHFIKITCGSGVDKIKDEITVVIQSSDFIKLHTGVKYRYTYQVNYIFQLSYATCSVREFV